MNDAQPVYDSILVIDDHKIVLFGLKLLLGDQFRKFYQAASGRDGIALALEHQPLLVIVDNKLPDIQGDEVVRAIRANCPGTMILGYSFNVSNHSIQRMHDAGIHGYVDKSQGETELIRAVNRMLHVNDRKEPAITHSAFSEEEIGIIRLICQQKTTKEISRVMGLSLITVEEYRSRITSRAGAVNTAGIVRFALLHKIIELDDL
jgi:DNA-binding NarL/FixJ family response regulator